MSYSIQQKEGYELNRFYKEDLPVHQWYRFVLSFPPHLVRNYLERFGITKKDCVLDPFCGTGTTLVECKKLGIPSIGFEANPVAQLAAKVKTDWSIDTQAFLDHSEQIATATEKTICHEGSLLRTLPEERVKLLIKNSISPLPLHKTLILVDKLEERKEAQFWDHQRIALAKQLVFSYSNLHFGPEVGVSRKKKNDMPVVQLWLQGINEMIQDIEQFHHLKHIPADAYLIDSRHIGDTLKSKSIKAVITSPPYPNEKDYTRTTRLESVLLGFIRNKADLRYYKQGLLRSNTRNVYKADTDERWVAHNRRINELSDEIEAKRIELGKTSGFEKLYHRVVKLYFGGMAKHLEELKPKLCHGAYLAYVVGDQASYFRILIRTGELFAEIAEKRGYKVESIDLFRKRLSTGTKNYIREEVVVLRWLGDSKGLYGKEEPQESLCSSP